jgi:hypothetical protein
MKKTFIFIAAFICLLAPLAAQTIKVDSPNGGESMALGGQWQIAWTATNVGVNVKIQLIKPGGAIVGVIEPDWAPGGSPCPWTVGQTSNGTADPGNYKIRVMALNGSASDASDNAFTITPAASQPALHLLSPNGGEKWVTGGKRNITWNAANWTGLVNLLLFQSGSYKGIIARSISSAAGNYEWTVAKLEKGMVEIGEHYKVRAVKEYSGKVVPLKPLMDESDGEFSIVHSQMTELHAIEVTKPAAGAVYEYGSAACGGTPAPCVAVPIQWTTDNPRPFEVDLFSGSTKVKTLLTHTNPPFMQKYSTQYIFTPANASPGVYRIVVRSIDGNSGASGNFTLRHPAVEESILPAIRNRRHWKTESYQWPGTLDEMGRGTNFADRPDWARTGFEYSYRTDGAWWWFSGHVFRSRLLFDITRFKGRKGKIVAARLQVDAREPHHTTDIALAEGETKVFALNLSWENREFFDAPATLVGTLPHHGSPGFVDLMNWVPGWVDDTKPNHGIMIIGGNESMEQTDKYFCTYYKFSLRVKFQDE